MKHNSELPIKTAPRADKDVKQVPLYNIPMMTDEMWNELAKRKAK